MHPPPSHKARTRQQQHRRKPGIHSDTTAIAPRSTTKSPVGAGGSPAALLLVFTSVCAASLYFVSNDMTNPARLAAPMASPTAKPPWASDQSTGWVCSRLGFATGYHAATPSGREPSTVAANRLNQYWSARSGPTSMTGAAKRYANSSIDMLPKPVPARRCGMMRRLYSR